MKHLTDREFIDYCLKFETDPKIVRLAKVMDNMPGIILDELEYAGMDPENCTFENTYSPGQYITHLENEIEYLNRELSDTLRELEDCKEKYETMTVSELINTLKDKAMMANHQAAAHERQRDKAVAEREEMKNKLDMWAILNR
jgi:hypothetical protein